MSDRFIALAKIGGPTGVKGEVRVKSFTAEPENLAAYGRLMAADGRVFEIERMRPSKTVLVTKFRGIDDRNAATALNGVTLGVTRDALPEPDADEFYHADLIGLAAIDASGARLGTVTAIYNHGAGDILEIAEERGTSLLVPFTRAAVPDIDIAGGRIVVDPPAETEVKPEESEEEE